MKNPTSGYQNTQEWFEATDFYTDASKPDVCHAVIDAL
jgi:hypothetical protein